MAKCMGVGRGLQDITGVQRQPWGRGAGSGTGGGWGGGDDQVIALSNTGNTCLKRSNGRDRLGVPVRKMALRLRLTADTAASVCLASGGLSLVRRVWLSSAMMIFHAFDAKQCCSSITPNNAQHCSDLSTML